jgi:hypothetical protein
MEQSYFGILPAFVSSCMNGRLKNSIVIAMGCHSLEYKELAELFVERGADVYIGWNGSVTAIHTDTATAYLLQQLVTQEQTIEHAIHNTMIGVGPDPECNSVLSYYPNKAGEHTVKTR